MKTISETIAKAIVESIESNNGCFSIEVEVNNSTVYVDGSFEIDGYFEDDYFNGTGAWVNTYVSVCIESVEAINEEGETVEFTCNIAEIERMTKDQIAA